MKKKERLPRLYPHTHTHTLSIEPNSIEEEEEEEVFSCPARVWRYQSEGQPGDRSFKKKGSLALYRISLHFSAGLLIFVYFVDIENI